MYIYTYVVYISGDHPARREGVFRRGRARGKELFCKCRRGYGAARHDSASDLSASGSGTAALHSRSSGFQPRRFRRQGTQRLDHCPQRLAAQATPPRNTPDRGRRRRCRHRTEQYVSVYAKARCIGDRYWTHLCAFTALHPINRNRLQVTVTLLGYLKETVLSISHLIVYRHILSRLGRHWRAPISFFPPPRSGQGAPRRKGGTPGFQHNII